MTETPINETTIVPDVHIDDDVEPEPYPDGPQDEANES